MQTATIPTTASGLLAALSASQSAPEPERTAWEAPSASIPDSVLYEPVSDPARYTAREMAETARRAVEAAEARHAARLAAERLHPPIQVTPFVGRHVITYRRETSDVWAVIAVGAVVCAAAGWHLSSAELWTCAAVLLVLAGVAWVRR